MVNNKRKSISGLVFDILNICIMVILSIVFLYPFWSELVVSFSTAVQANAFGLNIWPRPITFANYIKIFQFKQLYSGYMVTIFRTSAGGALNVLFTMIAAFVLAKRALPFRKFYTLVILFTMFFNGGLIPNYILIRNLGLMDSLWALILPGLTGAWSIIIARNFIMALPESLEEAAVMDGAGPLRILVRVIFPIAMPIIAVLLLWSMVGHWNAWYDALLYIRTVSRRPLQLALRRLWDTNVISANVASEFAFTNEEFITIAPQSVQAADIMISIGPIIALYPFLQKHFVKGILVGSLKG